MSRVAALITSGNEISGTEKQYDKKQGKIEKAELKMMRKELEKMQE